MLSTQHIRARTVKGVLRPRWLAADAASLALAEALIDAAQAAASSGDTRAQLEAEFDDIGASQNDQKLADGLAKLCLDRMDFQSPTDVDAPALRAEAFAAARAIGPIALERGPLGRPTADDVLEQLAAARQLDPMALRDALFSDLPEAQRATGWAPWSPEALVDRYNVALVQALLLSASEVRLTLHAPTRVRLRQLLRWARFHQLICSSERTPDGLVLVFDGPASLFSQSTRYGLQLASFFPAILLQDRDWVLEATIRWGPQRLVRTVQVRADDGLRTERRDDGAWQPQEERWFLDRFAALETGWQVLPGDAPIDLGGQGLLVPNVTFVQGDRCAHLEIVGYWTPDWLRKRVALLRRYGPGTVLLAVSRKRCAAERPEEGWGPEVIEFSQIVPPKGVLAWIDQFARVPSETPPRGR